MTNIASASTGLIYGTDTGNTEEVGEKIADALAEYGCPVEMMNISETSVDEFDRFDFLIFGIPTWDFGGIQEDWEKLEEQLKQMDLSNKVVALYGLG